MRSNTSDNAHSEIHDDMSKMMIVIFYRMFGFKIIYWPLASSSF